MVLQALLNHLVSFLSIVCHVTVDLILFEDARDSICTKQVVLDDKDFIFLRLLTIPQFLVY